MSEEENDAGSENGAVPASVRPVREPTRVTRKSRFSWIWLVPIIALIAGASLLLKDWFYTGPTVTVSFASAEGLEVGQTKLRYRDVVIGDVTRISVAPDRKHVQVHIQLQKAGSEYITQEDSKFWVVRPRLGISGVSGLGTLLSGAYISVDAPTEVDDVASAVTDFEGLEQPPEINSARPGTRFTLTAPDLGSLEIGSPVYFQRIQVGQVIGYGLDEKGDGVRVQVFVDAPNDRFVSPGSRFWNVSGVNMSLDATGFSVQTASIVSALAGGVAFSRGADLDAEPAIANAEFELFPTQGQALAEPDGDPFELEFHLYQSVRGLRVGAPVDFQGLELGNVTSINLNIDQNSERFYTIVRATIYPLRLGAVYDYVKERSESDVEPTNVFLESMVNHGLRAQMRAGNMLTGQQYIALDFFPDAKKADFDPMRTPVQLPVVRGDFDRLQQQFTNIVNKLETMPLKETAESLNEGLASLAQLIQQLQKTVVPGVGSALESAEGALQRIEDLLSDGSPMSNNLEQTLGEMNRALRSLNDLTSELQSQPSSLLRGRAADKLPESRR
ncbi:MlaD family protein [Paenalcaligenes niemegkensis]|uniref:PqiB family protein n=1 Tax=Paenalcaligenes niemegkensis TaxID=2895469 RepID=UPI001EE97E08|nr:MlaD family protein [Paenalcaligenes niemegkensis]MCQ9616610.1 MlaD family protein [Paenalcaligenes niemegkensis]